MHRELVKCRSHMSIRKYVDTITNGSAIHFKFGWIIIRWLRNRHALSAHIELVAKTVAHRQRVSTAQRSDLPILHEWDQSTFRIPGFYEGVDVVNPKARTYPGK